MAVLTGIIEVRVVGSNHWAYSLVTIVVAAFIVVEGKVVDNQTEVERVVTSSFVEEGAFVIGSFQIVKDVKDIVDEMVHHSPSCSSLVVQEFAGSSKPGPEKYQREGLAYGGHYRNPHGP